MSDERITEAVRQTEILRPPRQNLYSFGTTNLYYYIVTEPVYADNDQQAAETVIREGKVIAERPKIVTPLYLSRLEGFSAEARRYFESIMYEKGPNCSSLLYTYKNEPKELNIVSDALPVAVAKLNEDIDRRGDPLVSIIKGTDELWDVSLMKFIYEITRSSLSENVLQFNNRGLLNIDSQGIPADARLRIEDLFRRVSTGEGDPNELKVELDRWCIFSQYEDRFFSLFKARR